MSKDPNQSYQRHDIVWHHIPVVIYYKSPYINVPIDEFGHTMAHLVIITENRQPLPITKTGYKSHFIPGVHIDSMGGPVQFSLTWLDQEAKHPSWKAYQAPWSQLKLF